MSLSYVSAYSCSLREHRMPEGWTLGLLTILDVGGGLCRIEAAVEEARDLQRLRGARSACSERQRSTVCVADEVSAQNMRLKTSEGLHLGCTTGIQRAGTWSKALTCECF